MRDGGGENKQDGYMQQSGGLKKKQDGESWKIK